MKLANNRLRTRYWIEADNGKVLVDSFKLFSKKKIGPFISVVTDDNDEYLITSDTVFKGYSHVECINQLCYVVTNIIGNIARSSTYDMEGNIISHDMQVFVQKNDGLLTAKSKGKYGFVDTNLNWVIEPMFLAIITRFRNGIAVVKTDDKTIDTCVAINKKGEIIGKEIKYEKIQKAFGDYLFSVEINNLKGVYDYVGNEIIPVKYQRIERKNNYYILIQDDLYGMADICGNILLECKYDRIVEKDDKFLVYECKRKEILKDELFKDKDEA